jgi:hypothetical protein
METDTPSSLSVPIFSAMAFSSLSVIGRSIGGSSPPIIFSFLQEQIVNPIRKMIKIDG